MGDLGTAFRMVSFGATIFPLEGMDGSTARAAIVVFCPFRQDGTGLNCPSIKKLHRFANYLRTRCVFVEGLPVPWQ